MGTTKQLALPALALLLASVPGVALAQYGPPPPPPPSAYGPGGGWDIPPGEFREVERQGFRDGVDGARRDVENHRRADVNNRDEFRHPHVDRPFRREYREGFRRGYNVAMQHLYYGAGPRPY